MVENEERQKKNDGNNHETQCFDEHFHFNQNFSFFLVCRCFFVVFFRQCIVPAHAHTLNSNYKIVAAVDFFLSSLQWQRERVYAEYICIAPYRRRQNSKYARIE